MYETVVAERRLAQLDLAARAKFAADGETVHETRSVVDDLLYPQEAGEEDVAGSIGDVTDMFLAGLMEVG